MRLVYLVVMAMAMFTVGVIVVVTARDLNDHLLGGAAILGAIAVVLANVFGEPKDR
jgi:hypothetical protein